MVKTLVLKRPVQIGLVALVAIVILAVWVDNLDREVQTLLAGLICGLALGILIGAVATAVVARPTRPSRFPDPPRSRPDRPLMLIQPGPGEGPEVRWPEAQKWTPSGGPADRRFRVIGEDYTEE